MNWLGEAKVEKRRTKAKHSEGSAEKSLRGRIGCLGCGMQEAQTDKRPPQQKQTERTNSSTQPKTQATVFGMIGCAFGIVRPLEPFRQQVDS